MLLSPILTVDPAKLDRDLSFLMGCLRDVLDEAGEVIQGQSLSMAPKAMKEWFGAMPRSQIALETGTHWPWASRPPQGCRSRASY